MKALACELPRTRGVPLSRFSTSEVCREVTEQGIVAEISGTTVWRWLHQDAIRPWRHRSWIFPRDPAFAEKAGRVLDLYAGRLGKPAPHRGRLRALGGREDQHPGTGALLAHGGSAAT